MLRKPIPLPSSLAYIHRPTFSLITTQILLCVYVDVPPHCHKIPQTQCPSCSSTRARRHKINVPLCTHASPLQLKTTHTATTARSIWMSTSIRAASLSAASTHAHTVFSFEKMKKRAERGQGRHRLLVRLITYTQNAIISRSGAQHLPCAYYMFQCSVRGGCCFNREALHTSSLVSFLTSLSYLWLHTYPDPITHLHTYI